MRGINNKRIVMMNKYCLLAYLLLLPFVASAQVTIRVTDADTYMPLQGVVVTIDTLGWLTGANGSVVVYPLNGKTEMQVSLLGYKTEKVAISNSNIAIKLKRQYKTMTDVEIRARALRIDSIVRTVAERIPQNYLPADITVPAKLRLLLLRGKDTVTDAVENIYLHNDKKNTWLDYELYKIKGTEIMYRTHLATYEEVRNYIVHVRMLPQTSFAEGLFNLAEAIKQYHIVMSTFTNNGDKYYDLVFVNKKESKVSYSLLARIMGYGGKNNPNADLRYAGVFELIINTRNMALVHRQSITVATNKDAVAQLLHLKNREAIREWLEEAYKQQKKYVTSRHSFVPAESQQGKWRIYNSYYFDNFQHVAYRGDSIGDYTYVQEYLCDTSAVQLPNNVVPAYTWNELHSNCRPPQEKKNGK